MAYNFTGKICFLVHHGTHLVTHLSFFLSLIISSNKRKSYLTGRVWSVAKDLGVVGDATPVALRSVAVGNEYQLVADRPRRLKHVTTFYNVTVSKKGCITPLLCNRQLH